MPMVGDVLAERYRVLGPLGAGGMASVWRARDLRLGRDVAIKVLLPNLSADPATATRFDREARSLAAAAHPNVVGVFDVEPGDPPSGREPFYVMELCEGGSLADRLIRTSRLPPGDVAATIGAIAEGLADLHRRGMVHRDVKPHNILFCDAPPGGRPKLADFGLARSPGDGLDSLTATGTTIGTLAYLAPEVLGGEAATPASDVYALAVVAFQALTGRLPRPAASVTQVVEGRSAPAALVSAAAPDLGTAFDPVLAPALSPEPSDRPGPTDLAGAIAAAAAAARGVGDAPTEAVSIAGAAAGPVGDGVPAVPNPPPGIASAPSPVATAPGAGPSGAPAARPIPAAHRAPGRPRSRPALGAVLLAALVIAALAIAGAILGDPGADPGEAGSSQPGVPATDAPVETPAATAVVTPPPATPQPATSAPAPPAPTPPPVDPAARPGLDALPAVREAIAEASAGGLDDATAASLTDLADAVEAALLAGDLRTARARAEELADMAKEVARGGGDDDDEDDRGPDPLRRAAEQLRDAIPGD